MPRLQSASLKRSGQPGSRSGSTEVSYGAGMPGTGRSANRSTNARLFVPVISTRTDARREGYFRREWKLAVERTHDMSERVAFLVPVVIDDTSESNADVPDRFREVQWTRLPGGETPAVFVERIQRLLSGESHSRVGPRPTPP